jgi:hypothetical protein
MDEDLIRRLRERIRRTPSTDLECVPPVRPRRVLTFEELEMAESVLGFVLPPLVRSLYLQVADGGYGPGWGILPLNLDEQPSIVAHDHWFRRSWEGGRPPRGWPEPFVRFCEWGCGIYSGIDCSRATCPLLRFDPHRGGQSSGDALTAEADSLAEWLTAWLDGEKLWERGAAR